MSKLEPRAVRWIRHRRVREKVKGTADRPRLCVFRSLNHVYAQLIDDVAGHTLAAASTLDPEARGDVVGKGKTEQASLVGSLVAKRALDKGLSEVVFDRGGYKYHGRIKSLAEAARQGGLKF